MAVFYIVMHHIRKSECFTVFQKWAVTPVRVLGRLPMQPKTRKSPSGDLPRIASTAHGRPRAHFSQAVSLRELVKNDLQRAYPPDPLNTPKTAVPDTAYLSETL